ATVVGDEDLQPAGAVAGLQPDRALGRLASRQALLRPLDAVVDGIAQEMPERRVELFQYVAVDLGRSPDNLELDPLAERAAEVAHDAWIAPGAIGEWPHAAGQRLVIEPLGQQDRPVIEQFELGEPLRQK